MALRGTSVIRREDDPLLRGEANFVADLSFDPPTYVFSSSDEKLRFNIISKIKIENHVIFTCQNKKCSLIIVFTASLDHTSRLSVWH